MQQNKLSLLHGPYYVGTFSVEIAHTMKLSHTPNKNFYTPHIFRPQLDEICN